MRFGYAVRQAEIRHQALNLRILEERFANEHLIRTCERFAAFGTAIGAYGKADGAVGTYVPLPVESEMCRKVRDSFLIKRFPERLNWKLLTLYKANVMLLVLSLYFLFSFLILYHVGVPSFRSMPTLDKSSPRRSFLRTDFLSTRCWPPPKK